MRVTLLSALALLSCAACSMSEGNSAAEPFGGSNAGGSSAGPSEQPDSLDFLAAPSELEPRQELSLVVQTSPPGEFFVRFTLPAGELSDPLDAVLDRSYDDTDKTGRATVVLLAPSSNARFVVRASIGTISSEHELTVSNAGSATVEVQPTYAGRRDVTTWVASARPYETCADAPAIPPPDGATLAFAPKESAPELVGVLANVPVAITLRSGHYMGGCASVEMFPAGPEDRRHLVKVTVLDRPIELAASTLSLSLSLEPTDTAFAELNQTAQGAALLAMLGTSSDDADALLDTMRASLSGVGRQNLDLARKAESWDDLVRAYWGVGAATRLRDRVSVWLASGALQLSSQEHLFEGELRPVDAKSAELLLSQVAGLSPTQAGLVSSALVSWSADADDTVVLGTDLYLSSSRLATGLAEAAALQDFTEAETAAQALELWLDCDGLAAELAAAGSDALLAYPDCDAACLAEVCSTATTTIWQRGRDASSSKPTRLALTAAGEARVGDAAEVAGIRGSWVGELTGGGVQKSTGGLLSAAQPAP